MGREKIYRGTATTEIHGSPTRIWTWVRSIDSALYWHPHCVQACAQPNSRTARGEECALVFQHGDGRTSTAYYSVVEIVPGESLEYRPHAALSPSFRVDLSRGASGTTGVRVSVSAPSPKRSFRRWVNPTPALTQRAQETATSMRRGFEASTASPRRSTSSRSEQ